MMDPHTQNELSSIDNILEMCDNFFIHTEIGCSTSYKYFACLYHTNDPADTLMSLRFLESQHIFHFRFPLIDRLSS